MVMMSYSVGFGLLGLFVLFVVCELTTPSKDKQRGELMYSDDEE